MTGSAIAGFGERDQIIDRAAVLDDLAVALLARARSRPVSGSGM